MDQDEHRYYNAIMGVLDDMQTEFKMMHNPQLPDGPELTRHQLMFDGLADNAEEIVQVVVEKYNLVHPMECPSDAVYHAGGSEYTDLFGQKHTVPLPPDGKIWYFDWLRKHKIMEEENNATTA